MLKIKAAFALAILCAVSFSSYATLQPAAEQLNKILTHIQSLKAHFKQTVFTENKKIIQNSAGNMEFKRPSQFRWQVTAPDKSLVVTDGNRLWNYDVDLEQVTVQKFSTNGEVTPISFLFDDIEKLNEDFKIEVKSHNKMPLSCFMLTPKKETNSFTSVQVCFEGGQLHTLYLYDHLQQTSKFDFDHVQKNPSIAAARFNFIPPTGVDIVGDE